MSIKDRTEIAAGYAPEPIETGHVTLPPELTPLMERLAENAHDVWAAGRMADGWTYGPCRDDQRKKHPDLLPYDALEDSEKEYDRRMAAATLKGILALGFQISRP